MLRSADGQLKLLIFGDDKWITRSVRSHPGVVVMGNRRRGEVIDTLRRSRYYISTTRIVELVECRLRGGFLRRPVVYISDIGPHRELLAGMPYDHVAVPGLDRPMLRVTRSNVSTANLRSWDQVINEMIARIDTLLPQRAMDRAGYV